MKYKVKFTVQFTTEIDVPAGESFTDVISDIDVPDNQHVQYVGESFDVDEIVDENGGKHAMGDDYLRLQPYLE